MICCQFEKCESVIKSHNLYLPVLTCIIQYRAITKRTDPLVTGSSSVRTAATYSPSQPFAYWEIVHVV